VTSATRSRTLALGASIASFVAVAVVAAAPGSPFTPVLPPGAESGGPFRWLAELVGLDALHGSALAAVGLAAVVAAAGSFVLVLRACWRGAISVGTVVALTVAYHVALLLLPLLFSRDVYSYVAYGRIAATYSANPYVATPADFPADAVAPFVGPKWFDTPAVYGPLWTQLSATVVRLVDGLAASIVIFRLIAIAASAGTIAIVLRLVRRWRPQREAFAVAAIGMNPVVLFQSVASGHNDLLVALAVAAALALVVSRRPLLATGALAAGTLVKATAAVPLLLFVIASVAIRPRGERARALAANLAVAGGLGLAAALPFLNGEDPSLGMLELAGHEGWLAPSRFFRRLFDAISGDLLGAVPRVAFPLVLLGAIVLIARSLMRRRPVPAWAHGGAWGWGLLALMLLGPVLLPWYVTWTLPLAWLLPRTPRTALLGTSLALTVSQWTSEPARFDAAYDANIWVGHYVITPVVIGLLGWLLLDLWRRSRSGSPLEDAPDEVPAPAGQR
jgi:alpha-1,6-mannosyltransferase